MSRIEKFIVIYDIENTKIRTRLSRLLFEYGIRTQFSVFEVEVKNREFNRFIKMLEKKLKNDKDKIYVYPLDKKSVKNIKRAGNLENSIINDFFI
ncbi:CRISPR-associated endonuclease Cas2 [Caminibacter sp.]